MPDSACPDGTWESVAGRPTECLRPGVLRYHGFRARFSRPRRRLELPSGTVTLVVGFDEKLSLDNARGHGPAVYSAVLTGVHASAGTGGHQGLLSGMEIVMAPWAAYSLLGAAMHELAGRHLAAEDVLGRRLDTLADALATAPDWPRRFALVDAALTAWGAAGEALLATRRTGLARGGRTTGHRHHRRTGRFGGLGAQTAGETLPRTDRCVPEDRRTDRAPQPRPARTGHAAAVRVRPRQPSASPTRRI